MEVGAQGVFMTADEAEYVYEASLEVEGLMPSAGMAAAGAQVSLYGWSIKEGEGSTCVTGARRSAGVVGRAGEMVCRGAQDGEGFVALEVSLALLGPRLCHSA